MARSCTSEPIRGDLMGGCRAEALFGGFGGDAEDRDPELHPLGCRHAPGRACISVPTCVEAHAGTVGPRETWSTGVAGGLGAIQGGVEAHAGTVGPRETWSTRIAGGLGAIQGAIEAIEAHADTVDGMLGVEQAGMDLSQHSLLLVCEVCMRHSVVSYECYLRTLRGSGSLPSPAGWCGVTGVHVPFATAGEYYLHLACTARLFTTPRFSLSDPVAVPHGTEAAEGLQAPGPRRPRRGGPAGAGETGMEEAARIFHKRSRPMPGHSPAVCMDVDVAVQGQEPPCFFPSEEPDWRALEEALQSDEEDEEGADGGEEGDGAVVAADALGGRAWAGRAWALTLWVHLSRVCLVGVMEYLVGTGRVRFLAYGDGVCPLTHGLYYRVFLSCNQAKSVQKLAQWFGQGHHYERISYGLRNDRAYRDVEPSLTKLGAEPRRDQGPDGCPVARTRRGLVKRAAYSFISGAGRRSRVRADSIAPAPPFSFQQVFAGAQAQGRERARCRRQAARLDRVRARPEPTPFQQALAGLKAQDRERRAAKRAGVLARRLAQGREGVEEGHRSQSPRLAGPEPTPFQQALAGLKAQDRERRAAKRQRMLARRLALELGPLPVAD